MTILKNSIFERITILMKCNAKNFIQAAVDIERELHPGISDLEAQGRVMMNIIEMTKDKELNDLWEVYSQGELQ